MMEPIEPDPADDIPGLVEPLSVESLAEARRAVEAIVLVATDPIPTQLLAQLLELPVDVVGQLCDELARAYSEGSHGFQLVEVGGGWRYQTHPDLAPYVERFALDGQSARMSSAALETLAIVAYKQPISRAQVSAIRGVNVDGVLRTLVARGYVEEVGRDTGAGQAVLFGTTPFFLERVGINGLDQLPALGDFVPSAQVVEALEQTLRVDRQNLAADADADAADFSDGAHRAGHDPAGPTDAAGDVEADVLDLRQLEAGRSLEGMAAHPAGTGDSPSDDVVDLGADGLLDSVIDLREVPPSANGGAEPSEPTSSEPTSSDPDRD